MSSRELSKQTLLGGRLDTHGVHLQKNVVKNDLLLNIIKLDTHGAHLQKKVVKNTPLLNFIKLDTHRVHL
jgi:hypothetical protein